MNQHSIMRFFNQLIKTIRQDIKSIGIITDKDGTLLLDDTLKKTLYSLTNKDLGVEIYLIINSGRTVQDVMNCIQKENIPIQYFNYIIGDNGGMCLNVNGNTELYKHVMDKDVVLEVINKFIEMGGNISDIRITDGRNIFAYPTSDVENYYRDTSNVVFKDDLQNLEDIDVTKLTLVGIHSQIYEINKFIKENIKGYKTHIGKTTFPVESRNNYRLDFTGMHTKGEAAAQMKQMLGLDRVIYLGNDLNDISMFSQAIQDDDFIVLANNEYDGITDMLIKYLQEECNMNGRQWDDINFLLLEENNVNIFLNKMGKILGVLNSQRKTQVRNRAKQNRGYIKQQNRQTLQKKRIMEAKRSNNLERHR